MKHKHDEKELVAQSEKVAEKYIKEKEHSDVEFTHYEFTPMHTLMLYGYFKKNNKEIVVQMEKNGHKLEVGSYAKE
ncbi:hypothetical protein JOD45_000265 [Scopulibacillus daqui]|uniref:Uncharacterized protein n=1 Tax=Scopulibacillus daqui TaxID=1469162 RepID=A0ABS2PX76_9BACL|nr:hypothetical protein [Scopulibacillus daqui]